MLQHQQPPSPCPDQPWMLLLETEKEISATVYNPIYSTIYMGNYQTRPCSLPIQPTIIPPPNMNQLRRQFIPASPRWDPRPKTRVITHQPISLSRGKLRNLSKKITNLLRPRSKPSTKPLTQPLRSSLR